MMKTQAELQAELANLKPGDTVMIIRSGWGAENVLDKVERITKTQIVLKNLATRYRLKNGREVGGSRSFSGSDHIVVPTQQEIAQIRHRNRYAQVRGWFEEHKAGDLDKKKLQAIRDIMRDELAEMYEHVG